MQHNHALYLKEMGLDLWQVAHPERLMGYQAPAVTLAPQCQLVLVCEQLLTQAEVILLERVLKSMQLTLDQAQSVTPEQWGRIDALTAQWVWFAGCTPQEHGELKALSSPLLAEIEGHTQHRRDLWQQIQSYES